MRIERVPTNSHQQSTFGGVKLTATALKAVLGAWSDLNVYLPTATTSEPFVGEKGV